VSFGRRLLCRPRQTRGPATLARSTDPWAKSTAFFHSKIIPKPKNPRHVAKRTLLLFEIKLQSTKIPNRTLKSKNISKYSPSHFLEIVDRSSKLFLLYLLHHNSDFDDSCAKFLRIIHSFISCIHNTCLSNID
jgi:hypothetical protein